MKTALVKMANIRVKVRDRREMWSTVDSHTSTNTSAVTGFAQKQPQLWSSWPAFSPWVTAVGATRFVGQKVGAAERASDQFGSGGGFSDRFDNTHATWQAPAVKAYLTTVPKDSRPPQASYSPSGRATPDVSALGEGYQVIVAGGGGGGCRRNLGVCTLVCEHDQPDQRGALDSREAVYGLFEPVYVRQPRHRPWE